MPAPTSIESPRQLVVEGKDAAMFSLALLRHLEIEGIQVQNFGGKDELRGFLKALRNIPGFSSVTSLGVMRDAETDAESAFKSVCTALHNAGLPVPTNPEQHAEEPLRVAVLILPDSSSPGMLETVCWEAIASDPVALCIDEYLACVEQRTGATLRNEFKSRAHAFLATREEPGLLLGQAAARGYWPWDSPAFDRLKRFVRSL